MAEFLSAFTLWPQAGIIGTLLGIFSLGFFIGRRTKQSRPLEPDGSRKDLTYLKQDLERYRDQQVQLFGAMKQEIFGLNQMQNQLSHDASKLAQALKGSSNVQGQWGELQLRSVLELAGLLPHVNFVEQSALSTASGILRPDVIVHLPGSRSLVIDAKAPLSAYLDGMGAVSDAEQIKYGVKIATVIKKNVLALSAKEYWRALPTSPDFVLMFIPNDRLLSLAGQAAPGLFDEAARAKVLIVSPTTLIALSKTIAFGWRQYEMEQHAEKLTEQGEALYHRLREATRSFGTMGKHLAATVEHYNAFLSTMETQVVPGAKALVPEKMDGPLVGQGDILSEKRPRAKMPLGSMEENHGLSAPYSQAH